MRWPTAILSGFAFVGGNMALAWWSWAPLPPKDEPLWRLLFGPICCSLVAALYIYMFANFRVGGPRFRMAETTSVADGPSA